MAPRKSILDSVWRQWLALEGQRSGIIFYASLLPEVMANPIEARLMGTKPHRITSEVWSKRSVVSPVQEVSNKNQTDIKSSNQVSEDNHAPLLKEAG